MELLRIVAMVGVLCVHANFGVFKPVAPDAGTWMVLGRWSAEMLSAVAVNCFVMLSGWFGIRLSARGVLKFLFQVVFIAVAVYLAALAFGAEVATLSAFLAKFNIQHNWFVLCYLALCLVSPLMNGFVKGATRRQFGVFLLCFTAILLYSYTAEVLAAFHIGAGTMNPACIMFNRGYSLLSFMYIYLLARYAALYSGAWRPKRAWPWLALYLLYGAVCAVAMWALTYAPKADYAAPGSAMLTYDNPLVIFGALALVLFFSRISLRSRLVNWIASGVFAVYLVHTDLSVHESWFRQPIIVAYRECTSLGFATRLFLILLAFFIAGIILDHCRALAWRALERITLRLHRGSSEPIR